MLNIAIVLMGIVLIINILQIRKLRFRLDKLEKK